MRFPISLPIQCASSASIHTLGWLTSSSRRRSVTRRIAASALARAEARDEIRLLASRFRRVAAQRGKRKHGGKLGVREAAFATQREELVPTATARGSQ